MKDDIDADINDFLDFWEKHGRESDELRVFNWVVRTPGCIGDFGCCSEWFDLSVLIDALYKLTGREEMYAFQCICSIWMRTSFDGLPKLGEEMIVPCSGCDRVWRLLRDEEGAISIMKEEPS